MKPDTIKKLRELPEFRELVGFLSSELAKLYSLEDLANISVADRVYILEGKLRAYTALSAILAPLIATVDKLPGADPAEYVV